MDGTANRLMEWFNTIHLQTGPSRVQGKKNSDKFVANFQRLKINESISCLVREKKTFAVNHSNITQTGRSERPAIMTIVGGETIHNTKRRVGLRIDWTLRYTSPKRKRKPILSGPAVHWTIHYPGDPEQQIGVWFSGHQNSHSMEIIWVYKRDINTIRSPVLHHLPITKHKQNQGSYIMKNRTGEWMSWGLELLRIVFAPSLR